MHPHISHLYKKVCPSVGHAFVKKKENSLFKQNNQLSTHVVTDGHGPCLTFHGVKIIYFIIISAIVSFSITLFISYICTTHSTPKMSDLFIGSRD